LAGTITVDDADGPFRNRAPPLRDLRGKPLHEVWRAGGNEYSRCLTHEKTTDGRMIRLNPATGVWETVARNPATGMWEPIRPPRRNPRSRQPGTPGRRSRVGWPA
jgi:hypothetical protein